MRDYIKPYKDGVTIIIKTMLNSYMTKLYIASHHIKVYVTVSAKENKANKQVIKFLYTHLRLRKKQVEIIKRKKSKNKKVYIFNMSEKNIIFKLNGVIS